MCPRLVEGSQPPAPVKRGCSVPMGKREAERRDPRLCAAPRGTKQRGWRSDRPAFGAAWRCVKRPAGSPSAPPPTTEATALLSAAMASTVAAPAGAAAGVWTRRRFPPKRASLAVDQTPKRPRQSTAPRGPSRRSRPTSINARPPRRETSGKVLGKPDVHEACEVVRPTWKLDRVATAARERRGWTSRAVLGSGSVNCIPGTPSVYAARLSGAGTPLHERSKGRHSPA